MLWTLNLIPFWKTTHGLLFLSHMTWTLWAVNEFSTFQGERKLRQMDHSNTTKPAQLHKAFINNRSLVMAIHTTQWSSPRPFTQTVISLATFLGRPIRKMDVQNAFLHGLLKENPPPPQFLHYVCKFNKAMDSSKPHVRPGSLT
jgi:hypothetical protein